MNKLQIRLFVAAALVAAALFLRLGVWQLDRLHQRRARNALVRARLDSAEIDVGALPRDTVRARFRRVRVSGVPDYDHEMVLAARTRQGSPGVNIVTPLRIAGRDTAVLVNRGWVYSPDAATIDRSHWRGSDSTFVGYVDEFEPGASRTLSNQPGLITRLTAGGLSLPYPVAPYVVIASGDTTVSATRPVQLGPPPLDEGPHFSYAIQWFGFAVVAVVGALIVVGKRAAD